MWPKSGKFCKIKLVFRFFASLNSPHDFLSTIFVNLGTFGIGIGKEKNLIRKSFVEKICSKIVIEFFWSRFLCRIFWISKILKFWNFENLKIWKFEILKFWNFEILKFWNFELKFWNFEILKLIIVLMLVLLLFYS